ncbi:ACP S-malonyltransferase [Teredinibacter purpureus]|uniref:ACP S-malonyltransferase n=1 Tax=Teredinibacter purpureus TaxID=2731756 RepID=UPI0005F81CC2|nr:ACP S-malonyltransferase [Teredinibacter purpureus]
MSKSEQLAFVFPGQGSQKIGMLSEIAEAYPLVKDTFDEAAAVLGYDLWSLVQSGSQEELNMTEVTQPALLVSSVALWRVWLQQGGVKPAWLAGHSLGEWSALVAAGVIAFADAIRLVRARGQYMQEAVPAGVGAMAAIIGLSDELVEQACVSASSDGEIVSPVNYNSPGQLVIAGHKAAVEQAMGLCKESGAKRALPLPVSAPFHTALMKPAAERLAGEIENTVFSVPEIPVVHNVNAQAESDPEKIKALMIEQIYSAVRWVECVQFLVGEGVNGSVECGPGSVLSGLNRRIHKGLQTFNTDTIAKLEPSLAELK